ncbi:hypothetical protein N7486_004151 [Penicillium sp. IBT 16267x]|nr:hypothetical protein N7486_004151 [Penicillium sp. IBT 16267x]
MTKHIRDYSATLLLPVIPTRTHDAHVGNFHVPLFFANPKLPQIEVNSHVVSTQILPTILDFLIESSSITGESLQIVKDLLPLYEGQTMLRPLIPGDFLFRANHLHDLLDYADWL